MALTESDGSRSLDLVLTSMLINDIDFYMESQQTLSAAIDSAFSPLRRSPGRANYIGGADISAICGINPYAGPCDIYARKLGLVSDTRDNQAMLVGRKLEPALIEIWQELQGGDVAIATPGWRQHPNHSWAGGTPDAIAEINGERVVLEIKTAGLRSLWRWGESGSDVYPHEYTCQVAWYCAIFDCPRAIIVALVAGDLRIYDYERDLKLEAALFTAGEKFWTRHILAKNPPDPDGSDGAYDMVRGLFPTHGDNVRLATADEYGLVAQYQQFMDIAGDAEKSAAVMKQKLMTAIGDDEGIIGDGWKITWKANKKGVRSFRVNWKGDKNGK